MILEDIYVGARVKYVGEGSRYSNLTGTVSNIIRGEENQMYAFEVTFSNGVTDTFGLATNLELVCDKPK